MSLTPRPYQIAARDAVLAEYDKGIKRTMVQMCTGAGKTPTACLIGDAIYRRLTKEGHPARILFLAHREELLTQAAEKFSEWTPHLSIGVEKGEQKVTRRALPDVVVASVPSLSQPKRLAEFDRSQFGLVIADEFHHATASTWQTILRAFSHCLQVGFTATPDRSDGINLGAITESLAYAYDLRQGISDKYLVPLYREQIEIEDLDLTTINKGKTDFSDEELEKEFLKETAILQVADVTVRISMEKGLRRPTLIFCPGVAHAEKMAEAINAICPASAAAISGKSASRDEVLRRFKSGQIQFLANCAILTEGVDLPLASLMSNCRPTKSRLLYAQMAGRICRLYPGKSDARIIDFTDASARHDLVSVVDIFDGNMDVAVKERATAIAKRKGIDSLSALTEATEEIGRERQVALAKEIAGKVRYSAKQLSCFTVLGILPRAGRYLGQEVTRDQRKRLEWHKIPTENLDRGQAEQVIDALDRRLQSGMCTPKQAEVLMRYGFDPNVPEYIARNQIDYIARRKWSITPLDRQQIRRMAGSIAA